jgi:hypothetical protein
VRTSGNNNRRDNGRESYGDSRSDSERDKCRSGAEHGFRGELDNFLG